MAGTIQISASLTCTNGDFKSPFQPNALTVVQTGQGAHETVLSVGFAASEAMPIGDVGTEGWLVLRNLDPTNYVTWGPDSAGTMIAAGKLKPGEIALFRMDAAATIKLQANTAACKVMMKLFED